MDFSPWARPHVFLKSKAHLTGLQNSQTGLWTCCNYPWAQNRDANTALLIPNQIFDSQTKPETQSYVFVLFHPLSAHWLHCVSFPPPNGHCVSTWNTHGHRPFAQRKREIPNNWKITKPESHRSPSFTQQNVQYFVWIISNSKTLANTFSSYCHFVMLLGVTLGLGNNTS